ncbi:unnamed protein product [Amoebophrya sp. A120]|nr:unnamed protein product [Amoebophrya sp. A120]|eukprot:GSA120T00010015001.1
MRGVLVEAGKEDNDLGMTKSNWIRLWKNHWELKTATTSKTISTTALRKSIGGGLVPGIQDGTKSGGVVIRGNKPELHQEDISGPAEIARLIGWADYCLNFSDFTKEIRRQVQKDAAYLQNTHKKIKERAQQLATTLTELIDAMADWCILKTLELQKTKLFDDFMQARHLKSTDDFRLFDKADWKKEQKQSEKLMGVEANFQTEDFLVNLLTKKTLELKRFEERKMMSSGGGDPKDKLAIGSADGGTSKNLDVDIKKKKSLALAIATQQKVVPTAAERFKQAKKLHLLKGQILFRQDQDAFEVFEQKWKEAKEKVEDKDFYFGISKPTEGQVQQHRITNFVNEKLRDLSIKIDTKMRDKAFGIKMNTGAGGAATSTNLNKNLAIAQFLQTGVKTVNKQDMDSFKGLSEEERAVVWLDREINYAVRKLKEGTSKTSSSLSSKTAAENKKKLLQNSQNKIAFANSKDTDGGSANVRKLHLTSFFKTFGDEFEEARDCALLASVLPNYNSKPTSTSAKSPGPQSSGVLDVLGKSKSSLYIQEMKNVTRKKIDARNFKYDVDFRQEVAGRLKRMLEDVGRNEKQGEPAQLALQDTSNDRQQEVLSYDEVFDPSTPSVKNPNESGSLANKRKSGAVDRFFGTTGDMKKPLAGSSTKNDASTNINKPFFILETEPCGACDFLTTSCTSSSDVVSTTIRQKELDLVDEFLPFTGAWCKKIDVVSSASSSGGGGPTSTPQPNQQADPDLEQEIQEIEKKIQEIQKHYNEVKNGAKNLGRSDASVKKILAGYSNEIVEIQLSQIKLRKQKLKRILPELRFEAGCAERGKAVYCEAEVNDFVQFSSSQNFSGTTTGGSGTPRAAAAANSTGNRNPGDIANTRMYYQQHHREAVIQVCEKIPTLPPMQTWHNQKGRLTANRPETVEISNQVDRIKHQMKTIVPTIHADLFTLSQLVTLPFMEAEDRRKLEFDVLVLPNGAICFKCVSIHDPADDSEIDGGEVEDDVDQERTDSLSFPSKADLANCEVEGPDASLITAFTQQELRLSGNESAAAAILAGSTSPPALKRQRKDSDDIALAGQQDERTSSSASGGGSCAIEEDHLHSLAGANKTSTSSTTLHNTVSPSWELCRSRLIQAGRGSQLCAFGQRKTKEEASIHYYEFALNTHYILLAKPIEACFKVQNLQHKLDFGKQQPISLKCMRYKPPKVGNATSAHPEPKLYRKQLLQIWGEAMWMEENHSHLVYFIDDGKVIPRTTSGGSSNKPASPDDHLHPDFKQLTKERMITIGKNYNWSRCRGFEFVDKLFSWIHSGMITGRCQWRTRFKLFCSSTRTDQPIETDLCDMLVLRGLKYDEQKPMTRAPVSLNYFGGFCDLKKNYKNVGSSTTASSSSSGQRLSTTPTSAAAAMWQRTPSLGSQHPGGLLPNETMQLQFDTLVKEVLDEVETTSSKAPAIVTGKKMSSPSKRPPSDNKKGTTSKEDEPETAMKVDETLDEKQKVLALFKQKQQKIKSLPKIYSTISPFSPYFQLLQVPYGWHLRYSRSSNRSYYEHATFKQEKIQNWQKREKPQLLAKLEEEKKKLTEDVASKRQQARVEHYKNALKAQHPDKMRFHSWTELYKTPIGWQARIPSDVWKNEMSFKKMPDSVEFGRLQKLENQKKPDQRKLLDPEDTKSRYDVYFENSFLDKRFTTGGSTGSGASSSAAKTTNSTVIPTDMQELLRATDTFDNRNFFSLKNSTIKQNTSLSSVDLLAVKLQKDEISEEAVANYLKQEANRFYTANVTDWNLPFKSADQSTRDWLVSQNGIFLVRKFGHERSIKDFTSPELAKVDMDDWRHEKREQPETLVDDAAVEDVFAALDGNNAGYFHGAGRTMYGEEVDQGWSLERELFEQQQEINNENGGGPPPQLFYNESVLQFQQQVQQQIQEYQLQSPNFDVKEDEDQQQHRDFSQPQAHQQQAHQLEGAHQHLQEQYGWWSSPEEQQRVGWNNITATSPCSCEGNQNTLFNDSLRLSRLQRSSEDLSEEEHLEDRLNDLLPYSFYGGDRMKDNGTTTRGEQQETNQRASKILPDEPRHHQHHDAVEEPVPFNSEGSFLLPLEVGETQRINAETTPGGTARRASEDHPLLEEHQQDEDEDEYDEAAEARELAKELENGLGALVLESPELLVSLAESLEKEEQEKMKKEKEEAEAQAAKVVEDKENIIPTTSTTGGRAPAAQTRSCPGARRPSSRDKKAAEDDYDFEAELQSPTDVTAKNQQDTTVNNTSAGRAASSAKDQQQSKYLKLPLEEPDEAGDDDVEDDHDLDDHWDLLRGEDDDDHWDGLNSPGAAGDNSEAPEHKNINKRKLLHKRKLV